MNEGSEITIILQEIAEDNLEKAFALMKDVVLISSENYERLFELKGKFKHIETENIRGTIDYVYYSIEMNNIRYGMIELLKSEFPNDFGNGEEDMGVFDYWDRFQTNSSRIGEFVRIMQEKMNKYVENSNNITKRLNKLKEQSQKRLDPSINQKVKGIMLEIATNTNTYRESMEKEIAVFSNISKTLISDLFNYMAYLSEHAPQGKVSLLISLEKNITELLQVYEGFEKIAKESSKLHSSKTTDLSQQIKVVSKKMLLLDHEMISASQYGIETAKEYRNQTQALIAKERLKSSGIGVALISIFRFFFRRLMNRPKK